MLHLSLRELRLITKNRNINGYESMPKDGLLIIIISNNKSDRKSFFEEKKSNLKKAFISQQEITFLN